MRVGNGFRVEGVETSSVSLGYPRTLCLSACTLPTAKTRDPDTDRPTDTHTDQERESQPRCDSILLWVSVLPSPLALHPASSASRLRSFSVFPQVSPRVPSGVASPMYLSRRSLEGVSSFPRSCYLSGDETGSRYFALAN